MAVGILGIGLTMVGSVFPVAVDQGRQSRDAMMAALCARSVAATIRARRFTVVDRCRLYFKTNMATTGLADKPVEIPNSSGVLIPFSQDFLEYNPNSFLYDQKSTDGYYRAYNTVSTSQPLWLAGNFVAVVFATPVTADGPYRFTIVVFKSRGPTISVPRPVINKTYTGNPGNPIVAGEYLYDTNALRGEAYRLDYIKTPTTTPQLFLTIPAVQTGEVNPSTASRFYTLPEALAVYHTIVGD